jgi:hypothetical protein
VAGPRRHERLARPPRAVARGDPLLRHDEVGVEPAGKVSPVEDVPVHIVAQRRLVHEQHDGPRNHGDREDDQDDAA